MLLCIKKEKEYLSSSLLRLSSSPPSLPHLLELINEELMMSTPFTLFYNSEAGRHATQKKTHPKWSFTNRNLKVEIYIVSTSFSFPCL